jgi:hypothetical protein
MKSFRDEINKIIEELHLSDEDFQLVRLTRYREILVSIVEKFTRLKKTQINMWWWNYFNEPIYNFCPKDVFEVLPELIDKEESVWFIIEDERKAEEHFWLYEGRINAVVSILKELSFEEYYIVSKKLEWILCENHHNLLIGSGKHIIEKMKSVNRNREANVVN